MKWVKAITTFCAAAIFSVALAGCAPTAKQEGLAVISTIPS